MNKNPPTVTAILADLVTLICNSTADTGTKAQAIQIAYEIGKSEGRLDGAKSMGDRLVATVDKATSHLVQR
jgi:hypothetical protein